MSAAWPIILAVIVGATAYPVWANWRQNRAQALWQIAFGAVAGALIVFFTW